VANREIEFNITRRNALLELCEGFVDYFGLLVMLDAELEGPLDANVAWLPQTCTSSWDEIKDNPGILLLHPSHEFL
jgi:hypothetical protein